VSLFIFEFGFVPTVKAEEPQQNVFFSVPLLPIQFVETDAYIRLNLSSIIIEFYKGTSGYNKIYSKNGSVLVYDDRIVLEYLSKAPDTWKQRGTPLYIGYVKISDYHYEVTRHYTDYLGTTYDIIYTVKSASTIKITINLKSGKIDTYRVAWYPSGITKLDWVKEGESLVFRDEIDWIGFDWNDVYQQFGNITSYAVESVAQGRKANIYFGIGTVNAGQTIIIDPTVVFSTVSITSVHTCPLDERTFVIAYHDENNDDFSFQIWDTNGTQVLAETDVDTTSGGTISYTSIGVSAFNSTTFVIGWYDKTDGDATFAVYNKTGSLLSGPTDASTVVGSSYSVQVVCLNFTTFIVGWFDRYIGNITFAVYDSAGTLKAGPINVDAVGSASYSVSVSAFNSTTFVIGWYDFTDWDVTFAVYNSAGTLKAGPTDADTDVVYSYSVSVSCFNSTYFVIGWFDNQDGDATFAVYDSSGNLKTGPTDADTTAGSSSSVQVAALNSTAFVISWYDAVDFDLSFATYLSDGTAIASATDIESWPTAANAPFKYQSPCSQETGTGIQLYNDNWIIAYANTTTQAIWRAYKPDGTEWDGTIPSGGQTYSRSASQSLTLSIVASKLFEITRPVAQAIGIALAGTKLFDITRMASQGITFNLATIRIADFIRTVSQSFNIGFTTTRIAEFFRSVSQTITTTLNVQRIGEFVRTASQTITLTLQGIGEKFASYFRNAALTITTTLNANRLTEVTRQASQTLNFIFNGERLIDITRFATQTITFVLQGVGNIVTEFERLATLSLTFTHGVMGIFDFPVDLALVLAAFAVVMAIVAIGLVATKKD
jgi:hypothetical protein